MQLKYPVTHDFVHLRLDTHIEDDGSQVLLGQSACHFLRVKKEIFASNTQLRHLTTHSKEMHRSNIAGLNLQFMETLDKL